MRPPSTNPPPTPVPIVSITRLWATSFSSSSWASARAATVASLSTNTGTPSSSPSTCRSGMSASGTLTDETTRPVANSTIEGTPIPTASTPSWPTSLTSSTSCATRAWLEPQLGGANRRGAQAAVAQRRGGDLRPTEIDANDGHGSQLRPPPARSSNTLISPASGTSIDAGTCGSASAPAPNAAPTALAFDSPVTRNTTWRALASAGKRQRHPRNERLVAGLRHARAPDARSLSQRLLVGEHRGDVPVGSQPQQYRVKRHRVGLAHRAFVALCRLAPVPARPPFASPSARPRPPSGSTSVRFDQAVVRQLVVRAPRNARR